jgi:hypothetical protein
MSDTLPRYQAYFLGEDGQRIPVLGDTLVVELAAGKEVQVDLRYQPAHQGNLTIRTGSELESDSHSGMLSLLVVRPAAANLVHVGVEHYPWQDSASE